MKSLMFATLALIVKGFVVLIDEILTSNSPNSSEIDSNYSANSYSDQEDWEVWAESNSETENY